MRSPGRFALVLGAAAVAAAGCLGPAAPIELWLYLAPHVTIVALLLNGRFVGEHWIAARIVEPPLRDSA